jgi:hypothetical protein
MSVGERFLQDMAVKASWKGIQVSLAGNGLGPKRVVRASQVLRSVGRGVCGMCCAACKIRIGYRVSGIGIEDRVSGIGDRVSGCFAGQDCSLAWVTVSGIWHLKSRIPNPKTSVRHATMPCPLSVASLPQASRRENADPCPGVIERLRGLVLTPCDANS